MASGILSVLLQILVVLDILFALVIVFLERKNPAVTWAWLMVVLFLPYLGFVIYLCFGQEGNKYNTFVRKSKEDEKILTKYIEMDSNKDNLLADHLEYINKKNIIDIPGAEHLNDLIYLNFMAGLGMFTSNNAINIYHEGNPKFEQMIEDIRAAKHYIHLQYYIVRNDNLAHLVIDELAKKAAEGVEVKMLIDGMGNLTNTKKLYKPLIAAGGRLGVFLPPHFVRINYRNHRKVCVIDGHYGYIGGLNIGDEYLGKVKRFGHWRDCHIRICGDAVKSLEIRFIMDWNYCFPKEQVTLDTQYLPILEKTDGVKMQIVSSGPDTKWPSIRDGYIKMIAEANESIYIQTPYFVPDDSIFEILKIAALSGIDVKIMIPAHPDHPFVYWAALSYLGELINAGVRCYQYENGFVHSKLLMIDGIVTSVGTANIDIRSFKLNFEINAFIYDEKETALFQKKFMEDIEDCTEIDYNFYHNRSSLSKIKESMSRLISPLL